MVLRVDLKIPALTHFLRLSWHMRRNWGQSSPKPSFHESYSSSANSVAISESRILYLFNALEGQVVGSDHKHQVPKHPILFAQENWSLSLQQLIQKGMRLVLLLIFLEWALLGVTVFIKGKLIEGLVCLKETHVGCDCMINNYYSKVKLLNINSGKVQEYPLKKGIIILGLGYIRVWAFYEFLVRNGSFLGLPRWGLWEKSAVRQASWKSMTGVAILQGSGQSGKFVRVSICWMDRRARSAF